VLRCRRRTHVDRRASLAPAVRNFFAVPREIAGSVGATADGQTWRQGSVRLPPDRVRSTTGAGDAFAAGVIFGLHEDWSVEASLRLGVAAAAACVQHHHTSNGIMSAETCLAAADAMGYRVT